MSSYTSTKTGREIDSAVNEVPKLAELISKIIEDTDKKIVSLEDNKADKKEIPKKTSDLENDSFYEKTPNIDLCEDGTINTRDIYVRDISELMLGMPKHIMITPDGVYISGDMENPRSVKINVDDIIFYDADGSVRFKLSDKSNGGLSPENLAALQPIFDGYGYDDKLVYIYNKGLLTDLEVSCRDKENGSTFHNLSEKADKKLLTELLTDKANTNEVYAKDENILIENGKIEIVCGGTSIFINDEGITLANPDQLITAYNDIIIDDNVYKTGIGNHRLSEKANTNDVLNNMRLLKDCGEVEKFTDLPDINNKIGDTYKVKESHIVENIETLSGYRQLIAKSDESDNMGDGWWWINLFELDGQTTVESKGGDVYDEEFNFIYSSESSLVVPTEIRDKILSCGFIYMYSDSWVGEYSVDKTTIFKVNQNDFVKWNGVQWDNLSGEFHRGFSEEEILKIFEEMLADLPNQHIIVDGLSANKGIDSKGSIYAKDDVVIMDDEKVYHRLTEKANKSEVYTKNEDIFDIYDESVYAEALSVGANIEATGDYLSSSGSIYVGGSINVEDYITLDSEGITIVQADEFSQPRDIVIVSDDGTEIKHSLSRKANSSDVYNLVDDIAIGEQYKGDHARLSILSDENEANHFTITPGKLDYNAGQLGIYFDPEQNLSTGVAGLHFNTEAEVFIRDGEGNEHKLSEKANQSYVDELFENLETGGGLSDSDKEKLDLITTSDGTLRIDNAFIGSLTSQNIAVNYGGEVSLVSSDSDGNIINHKLSEKADKTYVDKKLGDIKAVLDELHNYAQALISGGANK